MEGSDFVECTKHASIYAAELKGAHQSCNTYLTHMKLKAEPPEVPGAYEGCVVVGAVAPVPGICGIYPAVCPPGTPAAFFCYIWN